ncbi:MAG: hypothetical protein KGL53_13120, partial [Elusimicrobia bacterium]|nr:hypothetical protein [Elusimicrobiota bacterium]
TFDRLVSTLTVSAPALSEDTTYYLRVSALNHNGVPGGFAALGSTVTLLGGPALISPPLLAVYESSVTARWAAKAGGGYRLEASSTDFGAASPGGTAYSSTTYDSDASTLTVSGLDTDTTYYLRVAALNASHDPGPVTVLDSTSTLTVAPAALAVPFVGIFQSSITAAWAASPPLPSLQSAQGYRLDASTAADFTGTLVSSSTFDRLVSTLTVWSPALSADTTYYLRVAALDHGGAAGTALSLGATSTLALEPSAPSAYRAWLSSLTVSWTAVPSEGYVLEAAAAPDFSGTVSSTATPNGAATQLTVSAPALSADTTYYLRLASLNHNAARTYAAVPATSTLASPPTGVSVSAVYFSSATVQWTPASSQGYLLQASTSADFGGFLRSSATPNGAAASLSVLNLLSGTTYYLRAGSLNFPGVPDFAASVATQTAQSPKSWTGAAGDGNWYTDANWSPSGAPSGTESVTISVPASVTVDASSPAISFSSMTLGPQGGGAAVTLTLSTSIAFGQHVLVNKDASLVVDTTQTLRLSGDLTLR